MWLLTSPNDTMYVVLFTLSPLTINVKILLKVKNKNVSNGKHYGYLRCSRHSSKPFNVLIHLILQQPYETDSISSTLKTRNLNTGSHKVNKRSGLQTQVTDITFWLHYLFYYPCTEPTFKRGRGNKYIYLYTYYIRYIYISLTQIFTSLSICMNCLLYHLYHGKNNTPNSCHNSDTNQLWELTSCSEPSQPHFLPL